MNSGAKLPGTPEPMHHWRGANGLRLAGDSWGDENNPLVVLLHGGGQTRHAWKGAGERLAQEGFFAVAFDARGHGDSEWAPESEYGHDVMVEDLRCVLREIDRGAPALVGASMGGGTSLYSVGEGLVDATALVLVDIAPRIEEQGVSNIEAFMGQKPQGFDSLEDVAAAIANYQPQRPRPRSLDGLGKNVRLWPDGKYRWHWDPLFRPTRFDLRERHRLYAASATKLTLPVLLVRGGMSDVLTEEGVRDFRQLCRHAEYVSIPDAAHMVAGDRNDTFGGAVVNFLKKTVPRDARGVAELSELRRSVVAGG